MRKHDWQSLQEGRQSLHVARQCRSCNRLDKSDEERSLAAYKHLFNNLTASSRRIGREVALTFEQSCALYKANCYYCNRPPSNLYTSSNKASYSLKYTGIDRIDSTKGYLLDNVVPCCVHCNRAKMSLTQKEFYNLVTDIYNFRVQRLSRKGVEPSGSKLETPSHTEG